MKTYEFDVPKTDGFMHVTINHDDEGNYTNTEIGDFDHNYEILAISLGEDGSEACPLYEVLVEYDQKMKFEFAIGVRAFQELSDTSRAIIALTLTPDQRATVISEIFQANYYSSNRSMRSNSDIMTMLIKSLVNQYTMASIITGRVKYYYPPTFDTFFNIFKILDDERKYMVIGNIDTASSISRFSIDEIIKIANISDDDTKEIIIRCILRASHIRYLNVDVIGSDHLPRHKVVYHAINIIESIEDEAARVKAIGALFIHAELKPRQGERVGKLLLAVDPKLLCLERDRILRHNKVFTPSQFGKLYALLKQCPE